MKKFLEDLQQDELKARNFRLYGKIQRFLQGDFAVMQPHSAKHMIQILVVCILEEERDERGERRGRVDQGVNDSCIT